MNNYCICIYTPWGQKEEKEEARTSQVFLLWKQELRSKTKVDLSGPWRGRRSLGQGVSLMAAGKGQQKETDGITLQTPGNQLCSVNFVMVILVYRVQVTDVEGDSRPGRNESWERKEMSPTHWGMHNHKPARYGAQSSIWGLLQNPLKWANTSNTCHTPALCVLPLQAVIRLLGDSRQASPPTLATQQCLTLNKLSRFSFLFFFNVCVFMFLCVRMVICVPWHTCGGQRTTSGCSHLPPCLGHASCCSALCLSSSSIHLRVPTGSSVSISTSHSTIDWWNYECVSFSWVPGIQTQVLTLVWQAL